LHRFAAVHGVATSTVFRWRVDFGLSARKAPQLVTVALSDGAVNEVPTLAALRDLMRPPDGMMAVEVGDGRRVFAPADSSPTAVKRQLAKRERASLLDPQQKARGCFAKRLPDANQLPDICLITPTADDPDQQSVGSERAANVFLDVDQFPLQELSI
jgi:hypothetical protein